MRPPSQRIPLQAIKTLCRRCQSTSASASAAPATVQASTPRLRFAPSPTGHLHLGGLRTALLNHLVARKGKGKWILRIEDTDRARFVPGAIDSLRSSLEWAGLDYDEGIGAGGDHGPYIQSERRDLYHAHVKQLLENDHAYECFCSNETLGAIKATLHASGKRTSYDGRCRHLTDEERVRRKQAGEKYIIRFKDSGGAPPMPHDLVFGDVVAHTDTGHENHDDFVLMKSDGYPTYHLANVVDDHEMRITHVLRGEEWLPSLPKHVNLYRAFGWDMPNFAHLPLLVNEQGSKLSKRRDDVAIDSFKQRGYEPEAILNFLALLGWDYQSSLEQKLGDALPFHERRDKHSLYEIFTLPQLVQAFELTNLSRRKAMVNTDKLDFLNKMTLRRRAGSLGKDEDLVEMGKRREGWGDRTGDGKEELVKRYQADLRAMPTLAGNPLVDDLWYVRSVFDVELPRITLLNEMAPTSGYFFLDPDYSAKETVALYETVESETYVTNLQTMVAALEESKTQALDTDALWDIIKSVVADLRIKRRSEIMLQMRHALTGQKNGPGIPEIIAILGAERSLARMRAAIEYIEGLPRKRTPRQARSHRATGNHVSEQ